MTTTTTTTSRSETNRRRHARRAAQSEANRVLNAICDGMRAVRENTRRFLEKHGEGCSCFWCCDPERDDDGISAQDIADEVLCLDMMLERIGGIVESYTVAIHDEDDCA